MQFDDLYIGGVWTRPTTTERIEVHSPHDGSGVGSAAAAAPADIDLAVAAARRAFDEGPWPRMTPEERLSVIGNFAQRHQSVAAELAELVTAQNGSPIWFTRNLHRLLADQTRAYMAAAEQLSWDVRRPSTAGTSLAIPSEPVGVVAAIIPWNAPQQSALTKIIPALLAGCTVVLKLAPEAPLDCLLLGEHFEAAGLPTGTLSIVVADRDTSSHLVEHPGVDKIAFTGSTLAGSTIAGLAGRQLKRVSLELGGKSASIVLSDADLDGVVNGLRTLTFGNNGEVCSAHTRVIAHRDVYEDLVGALGAMADSLPVGDPRVENTYIGPLVAARQRDRVLGYVDAAAEAGARKVTTRPARTEDSALDAGHYVQPVVFADVDPRSSISRDEVFGPVLVVQPFDEITDAVALANDSDYGLSGGVWTSDVDRGIDVAKLIRTGTFSVNGASRGYDAPFGGYKRSGIGREYGTAGLQTYLETKSIAYPA